MNEIEGIEGLAARTSADRASLTPEPVVSVLMPAHNCGPYIRDAIQSVLTQTRADFELLVLDDGSNDDTLAQADSFFDPRVRLFRQQNAGRSAALNALLDRARGEFCALMDADDISLPERLQVTINHLTANPHLAAVLSGHQLLLKGRAVCPRAERKDALTCRAEALQFMLPGHDPTLVLRSAVGRTLRFNEELALGGGLDFVLRMVELHDVEVLGRPLYAYRIRAGSMTTASIDMRERWLLKVFNAARARRAEDPVSEAEFRAYRGSAASDPLNELLGQFTDSSYLQLQAGDRWGAVVTAIDAMRHLPFSPGTLKPAIYALSPRWLARWIRAH